MGGSVFASGPNPLYTPRMPRAVYLAVREYCHDILRGLFYAVASPIDGPGKLDFGDVDVLLALPKDGGSGGSGSSGGSETPRLLDAAIARLGAGRSSIAAHEGKASIAIPWPARFRDAVPPRASDNNNEPAGPAYIQVDIAVLPSLRRYHWSLFKHAHGDLWNILGSAVLRPLGFTVDERALWLRVPEIESSHRSRAKVFLTDDPAATLAFLGLAADGRCWDEPFPDAAALFAYCTTCRFFVLPDEQQLSDGLSLKANDRRRLSFRPLFRQWATEFVPAQRARLAAAAGRLPSPAHAAIAPAPAPTRTSARDAAFAFFPGAQARFEAARTSWLRERHLLAIRTAAKAAVPASVPGRHRGDVCAAVRRHLGIVMEGSSMAASKPAFADGGAGTESGASPNAAAEDAAAAWTVEGVTAYVQAEWAAIAAATPAEDTQKAASVDGGAV